MELVYLWVEEYKNIKNQGFNFSPRFECEYDEEKEELTINENKDYVSIFPENINVTAIVGENGSRKSNLLDLVMELDGWSNIYDSFFFVTSEKKIYTINFNKEIKTTYEIKNIDRTNNKKVSSKNLSNISFLSLSPFINEIDRIYSNSINFISIFAEKNCTNNHFIFDHFYLNIIQRIPSILEEESTRKLFNINEKPKYLIFKFNKYIQTIFNEEISEIISKTNKKDETDLSFLYQVNLNEIETLNKIFNLYRKIQETKDKNNKILVDIDNKIKKKPLHMINDTTSDTISRTRDIRQNQLIKERDKLKKEIEDIGNIKFYFAKDESSKNSFYFSNGELTILFLIDELMKLNSIEENLILLIDEIELFLHPNWQKKLLKHLISLFNSSKFKRQIIITSHSPFILSDLPKENIIFLEKGKQVKPFKDNEQTFGANIHTLLSHGFFMDGGLMGEFAKEKITEIFNYLKDDIQLQTIEEKNVKNIIELIGEDFLREKLLHMYNIKFPKSNEEKIKELEKEIERLKNA